MSLINQMLQELDARHAEAAGTGMHGQHVRAVPERRRMHPAWWLALTLAVVLAGVVEWLLLRPQVPTATPMQVPASLPLRLDAGLSMTIPPLANIGQPPTPVPANVPPAVAPMIAKPQAAAVSATASAPVAVLPLPVAENKRTAPFAEAAAMRKPQPALPELTKVVPPAPALAAPQATHQDEAVPRKQFKELTLQEQAENAYRNALQALQQGKTDDAVKGLEHVLDLDSQHVGAREALIGIFLNQKRNDDAARLARDGLTLDVRRPALAMILARLQIEKGELHPAIETLQHSLPFANGNADYQAFLAALLQRDERHKEAVEHYLLALQAQPQNGVWWMGLGISLQADHRLQEAREAFERAKATHALPPQLQAFVDARLSQLSP